MKQSLGYVVNNWNHFKSTRIEIECVGNSWKKWNRSGQDGTGISKDIENNTPEIPGDLLSIKFQ